MIDQTSHCSLCSRLSLCPSTKRFGQIKSSSLHRRQSSLLEATRRPDVGQRGCSTRKLCSAITLKPQPQKHATDTTSQKQTLNRTLPEAIPRRKRLSLVTPVYVIVWHCPHLLFGARLRALHWRTTFKTSNPETLTKFDQRPSSSGSSGRPPLKGFAEPHLCEMWPLLNPGSFRAGGCTCPVTTGTHAMLTTRTAPFRLSSVSRPFRRPAIIHCMSNTI